MAQLTITDDTPRRVYAVGGTPQSAFAVPFAFFATSDLDVYVDGVLLALSTDYTVATTAADDGFSSGTVNLVTPVSNATVIVELALPIERTSNFPTGVNTLNIFTLNTTLTRLFAILQQLRGSLARALTLQANDATTSILMPLKAARANKVLGFDANGDPIPTDGSTLGGAVVSGFMATVLDDADAATARGTLGLGSFATLSGLPAGSVGPTELAATAVSAGTYTNATVTVDADGRVTDAESGVAPIFSQIYDSGDLTITSGGAHTLTHSLDGVPRVVQVIAKCVTAEGGYAIGEEAPIGAGENSDTSSTGRGVSIIQNATQIKVRFGNDTNSIVVINATSGDRVQITNANWRLIVRAYR